MLRRLVAAVLPAAVLCSYAEAQTPARPAARDAAPASTLNLAGPNGADALTVTKQAPRQIRAGQSFDYTITVKNPSKDAAQGVTVYEELTGLTVQKADVPRPGMSAEGANAARPNRQANQANPQGNQAGQQGRGFQRNGNVYQYKLGDLAAGESRTITVTASAQDADRQGKNAGNDKNAAAGDKKADDKNVAADRPNRAAAGPQQAKACLWVDYNPTLCSTFEIVQPDFRLAATLRMYRDLALKQDEEVGGAYRCDKIMLETKVTSTGDAATAPATVMIDLPKGLTTEDGKSQLKMDLGALAAGKTVDRQTTLKLDPAQAGNEIRLAATATAGNLKADVHLPAVKVLDPKLDLKVEGGGEQYIGRPAPMKVTLTNPGKDPVLDARVQITSSASGSRFSIDGSNERNGMIAVGRLNPGESKTFNAHLESRTPMDATVNVKADGYCVAAIEKQAAVKLKGVAAVLIEVVDKKDPVPVGEDTVYEIAVKNQGTAPDSNIQLKATLPSAESFVDAHGASDVKANGETLTFGKVPTVAPGDVVSWTIRVKANEAAKVRFKVELTSDANKVPVIEQEPTTLY